LESIDIKEGASLGQGYLSLFKFVGSCIATSKGLNFYIVIYRVMLKQSSQELLHQMKTKIYLAGTIPMTRRLKFVPMKSLGSQITTSKWDTLLYRFK